VLNLGLESRRNRFGWGIVKAVLLLYSVVACVSLPIEHGQPALWEGKAERGSALKLEQSD